MSFDPCLRVADPTQKKSYGLSIIRLFGALLVFLAHVFSVSGNDLGNDIIAPCTILFLMLSGYLYSGKEFLSSGDRLRFVIRNFLKILIDYYLVVLLAIIPLYCFLQPGMISGSNLVNILLCRSGWAGVHHLWYIPHCLFSYLITPLLYDIKQFSKEKNCLIPVMTVLFILTEAILRVFQDILVAGTVFAYIFGYFLPELERERLDKRFLAAALPLSVLLRILTLWIKHYASLSGRIVLNGVGYSLFVFAFECGHNLFGICSFMILKKLFANVRTGKAIECILDITDRYAYDFYLVHMLFVMGCLSVFGKLGSTASEIIVSFLLSLAAAAVFRKLSQLVSKPVFSLYNRYF